jgi:acetyl-CoA acetyltransferase
MGTEVFAAGAAVHPFGKHRATPTDELGYRAVSELMVTGGVDPGLVDVGFGGSVYGGSLLAQRVMQRVGVSGQPVFTVENACASGASAVNLAWQAVASGSVECAIAFGAENLSAFGGGTLPLTTNDIEIAQGMVMPAARGSAGSARFRMRPRRAVWCRLLVRSRSNSRSTASP